MLTSEQISKLEPLFEHPKFDRPLKEGVGVWKTEGIPLRGTWGVISCNVKWQLISDKCCCLVAASMVNKPKYYTLEEDFEKYYDLSKEEYLGLMAGFDSYIHRPDWEKIHKEAYQFGFEVGKIIFG